MKTFFKSTAIVLFLLVVGLLAWIVGTARTPPPVPQKGVVPEPVAAAGMPAANPLRNAYFGELHLHTSYSMDANLFGTQNDPRMAYRFAQGEEVELPGTGLKQRIAAPLDFAAVTDHSEGLGLYAQCSTPGSGTYWSLDCLGMRYQVLLLFPRLFGYNKQEGEHSSRYSPGSCGDDGRLCIKAAKSVWQDVLNAANEHYRPGQFTTFAGFEYSPTLQQGGMMHRNVIYRGATVPDNVFSGADGFAEDLLRWLDKQCIGACQALSIPHNPNFSWGLMFGEHNANATPITRENLALRARYETLVEIFQAKGNSECARGLDTNDEQCGFENFWPACTPEQMQLDARTAQHAPRCVAPNDMVRNVLKRGLQLQETLGFNPYKLGFVGGTDNHNGTPGDTTESTYKGHGGSNDARPEQRLGMKSTVVTKTLGIEGPEINPGGLTGVWAEENSRAAIFDGLKRRESWGTSGTRIRVRLFGGFGLPADLAQRHDMVKAAYDTGVPMGGDLPAAGGKGADKAPTFLAWAARDLKSAALQRLQIVKGWVANGKTHERVYDVACADGLKPDANGRCPSNGATVNTADCSISKDKGAAELAVTWTDPDFRAGEASFYYVRVLENPVCRYSQHDANKLGVAHPARFPSVIQERAWSSPIWYSPRG